MPSKNKYLSAQEHNYFIDALREFLGLKPMPGMGRSGTPPEEPGEPSYVKAYTDLQLQSIPSFNKNETC